MRMGTLLGITMISAASGASSAVQRVPPLSEATVTIPYTELKSLWEAAQPQPQPSAPISPIPAVLLSAEYDLVVDEQTAVLGASYRVRSFHEGWQVIPLLGGDVRMENLAASDEVVVWEGNRYSWLVQGPGERTLGIRFRLPNPDQWDPGNGVRLRPGDASLNRLNVNASSSRRDVRIQNSAASGRTAEQDTFFLFAGGSDLVLFLEEDQGPTVPSIFDVHSEVLVLLQDGRLTYDCRMHAQAEAGSGLGMNLWLPQNALAVQVDGEDLVRSKLGRREGGRRLLELEWQTAEVLERTVTLTYQVPQSPVATQWTLQAPQAGAGGLSRSLFIVGRVEGMELGSAAGAAPPRRLPEWTRGKVEDFLTLEGEAEVVLKAIWLPEVETVQATASLARYRTRLVGDGSLLVEAEITIEHETPLSWGVHIPSTDEILTCSVGGNPAQPIRRGPTEIEFFLGAGEETASGRNSRVAFCYASKGPALDRVAGRLELSLPRTDLFIHELVWELILPESYETTAIEGNLGVVRSSGPEQGRANVIQMKQELLRGESPAAEIYYQRRGL